MIWVWDMACIGANRVFGGNLNKKECLEELGADRRTILKETLRKDDRRL
jgi:hypothetical protein